MKVIQEVVLEVIEKHLLQLRAGNHPDNMKRLNRFEYHYSVVLSEEDFFSLVFLQNPEVGKIAPADQDRTLRAVAQRAISLGQSTLSDNWNLATNLDLMRERLRKGNVLEPVVICEARNGEEVYGPWYLQDGSHRALAYAILMLLSETNYQGQRAYCSMSWKMQ